MKVKLDMAHAAALPWWSRPANRFNTFLLRIGLRIGTQHILSVRGRKSGRMRSIPVSLVTLGDARYVVSGEGLAWPVLRAFWHQVPHGRHFIARFFGLAPDAGPDDFEAAAPRCPVFRLQPVERP